MERRDFITLLCGSSVLWPFAVHAQKLNRLQLIAVLMANAEDDPNVKTNLNALWEGLHPLGWIDGKNVQLVYRATADLDTMWSRAVELVSLGPDVMVTVQTPATSAARQASRSIPIVFIAVSDPISILLFHPHSLDWPKSITSMLCSREHRRVNRRKIGNMANNSSPRCHAARPQTWP